MHYTHATSPESGVKALADRISKELGHSNVLWLICGGSNVPVAAEVMKLVRASVPAETLARLTVAQTDERYGPVGHPDSNWQQMSEVGFEFAGITALPFLIGESLDATVTACGKKLDDAFAENPVVIAQFGMGLDGHIAGVLPHTGCVESSSTTCGYTGEPFDRVSLSLSQFGHITAAYVFVFGSSKRDILTKLQNEDLPLADMPSQILKQLPEVYLYSDQIQAS